MIVADFLRLFIALLVTLGQILIGLKSDPKPVRLGPSNELTKSTQNHNSYGLVWPKIGPTNFGPITIQISAAPWSIFWALLTLNQAHKNQPKVIPQTNCILP